MDPALRLLLRLRLRGWLRRLGRTLGTVRGVLLAALGLLLLAPQILAVFVLPRPPVDAGHAEAVRRFGTLGLFAYCVLTLVLSSAEQALYFAPAEVSFLFPGPFRRRQLLAYKLGGQLVGVALAAVLTTLACAQHAPWLVAGYVGVLLALTFLQLFSVAVALVINTVGALAYNRGLLALAVAAALALAAALLGGGGTSGPGPLELLARAERSGVVRLGLIPLRWFVAAFTAERLWPDLVTSAALGLAVDAALLALVFALDARNLEAASAASARAYARIERLRRGGSGASWGGSGRVRVGLPMLPRWGGAGPIAWRQLTTALRDLGRVLAALLALGSMLVPALLLAPGPGRGDGPRFALTHQGILFGMTLFLTAMLPFDFRADLERMAELKALPIRASRLAIGQLLAPVVLTTAVQWAALAVLAWRVGAVGALFWALATFAPPYNALLLGVENLWFLLFPAPVVAAAGFDLQAVGRMVVLTFAKVVILAVAAGVAAGLGGLVYLASGSAGLALTAAWVALAGSAAGLIPVLALAFHHFDVARDTPA
ncbi:MAG TPA: putative ABC exporter domain-containing protein [Isosphaeraceae bacterium]